MDYQEFLKSIKAGQYIKTQYRDNKSIRKVSKVTRTQIVITEIGYDGNPLHDRFSIESGNRICSLESWYSRTKIISDPVSSEETATYEARIAEGERWRKERKRISEIEAWAKARLVSLFGDLIPADNIKVQYSSGFFEIKCEKISEEVLCAALNSNAPVDKTA